MKSTEDESVNYFQSVPRRAWVLFPKVCSIGSNLNLADAYPAMKPACQETIAEREGFEFFSYVFKFSDPHDCVETLNRVSHIINSHFNLGISVSDCMGLMKSAICERELFSSCQNTAALLSPRYRDRFSRTNAFSGKENTVFLDSKQFGVALTLLALFCSIRDSLQLQIRRNGGFRSVDIFDYDHENFGDRYLKRALNHWVYLHQDLPNEKARIVCETMAYAQRLVADQKADKGHVASCPF